MLKIVKKLAERPLLYFGLKYFILFLLLLLSLAMAAMQHIISVESNPFFYANF